MIFRRLFVDAIFQTDVQLVVCSVPEIRAWLQQHPEFTDDERDEDWHAAFATTLKTTSGPARWLVWLSPTRCAVSNPDHLGTLVHESLHVTAQVLGDRGALLSDESEEVFAYYLTAIFLQFHNALQTYARTRRSTRRKKRR